MFSVCFYSADNFKNKGISAQASIYKDRNSKNTWKRTQILEKEKTKTLAWFVFPLYINCRRSKRGNGTPTNSDPFREFEKPRKKSASGENFSFFFACKLYDFYRRGCFLDFKKTVLYFSILDNIL